MICNPDPVSWKPFCVCITIDTGGRCMDKHFNGHLQKKNYTINLKYNYYIEYVIFKKTFLSNSTKKIIILIDFSLSNFKHSFYNKFINNLVLIRLLIVLVLLSFKII